MEVNLLVRVYHKTLHCFDQSSLNVAGLGCLYSRIDKSFSTTHSVEEELGRCQAGQIRVLDEAARLGTVVVLDVVW